MIPNHMISSGRRTLLSLLAIILVGLVIPIETGCSQSMTTTLKDEIVNEDDANLYLADVLPPHYDELLVQAKGWSDEELERQIRELLVRYQVEVEWGEYHMLMWMIAFSKFVLPEDRLSELFEEHLRVDSGARMMSTHLSIALDNYGESHRENRAKRELAYATAAGWIDDISNRRKRLSRWFLEDFCSDRFESQLQKIWDPSTERVLELEDLLPADDESVAEVDGQSPADGESDL